MRLRWNYRHSPFFLMRRLDRAAGQVNVFLLVIALGLAALDILYAGKKIAAEAPRLNAAAPQAGWESR